MIKMISTATMMMLLLPLSGVSGQQPVEKDNQPPALQTSTFTLPATLAEGRDPFHPMSTGVIDRDGPRIQRVVETGPAILELKGISGTTQRPLALINNQTFAEGDEQQVTTRGGGKVKVQCLDIRGTKVKIRAQGQIRELMLRKGI